MLDYRAWIVAVIVALSAAGAYVLWITRPRTAYSARSLTAAPHPPTGRATKSLHVEGCYEDFIVSPGELVEPKVTPGSPLEEFRSAYGKETQLEKSGVTHWDGNIFSLTVNDLASATGTSSGSGNPASMEHFSLQQGHVVETLDGIELGIDSFGTIFRKMGDRKVEVHERMERGDGTWTLIVSLYSACGHTYRSEYSRTIAGSPDIDRLIVPRAAGTGRDARPSPGLWRSDVFMNKVVSEYTLVESRGRDDSSRGSPSEHD